MPFLSQGIHHFCSPFPSDPLTHTAVHSWTSIPLRLQGRNDIITEVLDVSSEEITWWGIRRPGGRFQRQVNFWTVSNPYPEMCALETSGLHNRTEAAPHSDGKWTCLKLFAASGKTIHEHLKTTTTTTTTQPLWWYLEKKKKKKNWWRPTCFI